MKLYYSAFADAARAIAVTIGALFTVGGLFGLPIRYGLTLRMTATATIHGDDHSVFAVGGVGVQLAAQRANQQRSGNQEGHRKSEHTVTIDTAPGHRQPKSGGCAAVKPGGERPVRRTMNIAFRYDCLRVFRKLLCRQLIRPCLRARYHLNRRPAGRCRRG